MKRFLKVLVLFIASLFLVASGVDAALDHLSHSPAQNSYTLYSAKGHVVATYVGDLACSRPMVKPVSITPVIVIHRT